MKNIYFGKYCSWICSWPISPIIMEDMYLTIRMISNLGSTTVYVKSFEGESFHGFCGFLLTANVLPLKIFLEYRHRPPTTQSMVPPGLINNEQSIEILNDLLCYHFFNSYCISISWISLFPLTNQLFSNYRHLAHMITVDKIVSFEFSCFFCHSTCV